MYVHNTLHTRSAIEQNFQFQDPAVLTPSSSTTSSREAQPTRAWLCSPPVQNPVPQPLPRALITSGLHTRSLTTRAKNCAIIVVIIRCAFVYK